MPAERAVPRLTAVALAMDTLEQCTANSLQAAPEVRDVGELPLPQQAWPRG
jgi:hypothetical protein